MGLTLKLTRKDGSVTTITKSGQVTTRVIRNRQPDKSKVSKFLKPRTTNIIKPKVVQTSRFLIPNNTPQSSNSGLINVKPPRLLVQSDNQVSFRGIQPVFNSRSNQFRTSSALEERQVQNTIIEQRNARALNVLQKERFNKITASNFGQNALGFGKNILGENRQLTPLGVEVARDGIKSVVDRQFPRVDNPTFTFGATFESPKSNKIILQRDDNLSDAEIAKRLDQQSVKKANIIPAPSFANSQVDIISSNPFAIAQQPPSAELLSIDETSLPQAGGLVPTSGLDEKTQSRAISVFGGQTKGTDPLAQFGFEASELGAGFVAGGTNLVASVFDLRALGEGAFLNAIDPEGESAFRVTKDSEGNVVEIERRLTPNPLTRIETPSSILEDAIFESAFATDPVPEGVLAGLPAFGTSERAGEIFNQGLAKSQQAFEDRKSFGIGASLFTVAEFLPFTAPLKFAKAGKVASNPNVAKGFGNIFDNFFRTKAKKPTTDEIVGAVQQTPVKIKQRFGSVFKPRQNLKEAIINEPREILPDSVFTAGISTPTKTKSILDEIRLGSIDLGKIITPATTPKLTKAGKLKESRQQKRIKAIQDKAKKKKLDQDLIDAEANPDIKARNTALAGQDRSVGRAIEKGFKDDIGSGKPKGSTDASLFGTQSNFKAGGGQLLSDIVPFKPITASGLNKVENAVVFGTRQVSKQKPAQRLIPRSRVIPKKPKSTIDATIGIPIGAGIGTGLGLGLIFKEDQDNSQKNKQGFGQGLGLIDDLGFDVKQSQIQDQIPKLDQAQIPKQDFGFPTGGRGSVTQSQPLGQIPKLGLLQFQGNPLPILPNLNFPFQPQSLGGGGGSKDDSDFGFFRVFSVAKQPFGRTTLPLGGFADSDRPFNEITDVLTTKEIFRENRLSRNPLRAPKNIIDEDIFTDNLFGILSDTPKKKKKKSKRSRVNNSIFDSEIFNL